jgi:hypothetical protein
MKLWTLRRTTAPIDDSESPTPRERRAFALPMAILIIAFLTVTISAAYSATSSEILTNAAQRGESKAYMVAQAGLENFLARRNEKNFCDNCGLPPAVTFESTAVAVPGGYAAVTVQLVRSSTNKRPAIYLLRSRGYDTATKFLSGYSVTSGSGVNRSGYRTVAQLVYWNVNQVNVLSGWTSTSGLDKNGSSGTITGVDANDGTGAGCPPQKPSVAGVAVPDGDWGSNGNFTPAGNPPVQYLGTQAAANAAVKIDWDGIVNSNRVQPDYTFATAALATAGWANIDFGSGNNLKYPVIRVNDNFSLPTTGGQGTLIVMGDLTMSGNNLWKGILLVGGKMDSNGNGTVSGATMSGLNTLLPSSPSPSPLDSAKNKFNPLALPALTNTPGAATANGTKTFEYNSCEVAKAAGGLASYSVYPNAWMDNYVTY